MRSTNGKTRWTSGGLKPVRNRHEVPVRPIFLTSETTASVQELKQTEDRRKVMEQARAVVDDEINADLNEPAKGHLTVPIDISFSSEYEQLWQDLKTSVDSLMEAFHRVVEYTVSIRGEAVQINAAAGDRSRRTEKQAVTLEQTAAVLDELTSSIWSAAEGAARANQVVSEGKENAEHSGAPVEQVMAAMNEIASSSYQISKIIGVIEDTAIQNNLFTLNGGVNTTHVVGAGRGGVVVASEIRALAERSSAAAGEIHDLISASFQYAPISVSSNKQSTKKQSTGLAEINKEVGQLDQVKRQRAAMLEETTAASHALSQEAIVLSETMSRFQVDRNNSKLETLQESAVRPKMKSGRSSAVSVKGNSTSWLYVKDGSKPTRAGKTFEIGELIES